MLARSETILAPATAPHPAGVGVLRLSGPSAVRLGLSVVQGVPPDPKPRHAYFCAFLDRSGTFLDQGLFLFFRAPESFTGEDVVELQAHGSPRLLSLLQAELLARGGVRLAEPGEFSFRAFMNGKWDLSRAEAVEALVSADSEAAVRAASAQLRGGLVRALEEIRAPLVALRADMEAELAYPEEVSGAGAGAAAVLAEAKLKVEALVSQYGRGRRIREGARVVLFGPVNAGKSTLFNRLVGEDRALVDPDPGTTRDLVEATVEVHGLKLTFVDTAGVRPAPGRVEALGVERTRHAVASADLAVLVIPPEGLSEEDANGLGLAPKEKLLRVNGKCDRRAHGESTSWLRVSGLTGEGVEALRNEIREALFGAGAPAAVVLTSERHVQAFVRAREFLGQSEAALGEGALEVAAGELGLALEALSEVTGENARDELLQAVFSRFCLGK